MSDTTMVDAAAVVAPAADATAPTVTSAATEATAAAPTPAAIPNEAAAPSSTAAPTAPAAPAALPHPAEYYVIPSSASHSSAPTYSESELAAIAALPADSAGYMPVIKHRLVNPYGAAGASDDARKSRKTDRDASAPSSSAREGEAATTAGEGAAAASEETTENKKRKRGQNKTHEREIYNQRRDGPPQIRLCRATAAGLECKFMEKCKYSHDTSAFTATKAADYPGACPIFSKYGACPAGLMCKYASEGHADSFRPAELPAEPFTTPLSHELNMISKDLLADARVAGLAGRRYEKLFPRTVDLMKRHDAWKRQFDALRQKKQNEKQAAQKEQMRQMKAAREAALVARNEAAAAALNAPTAAAEAKTEPAAESVAAADASVPATDAPAAADAAPVAAPIAAPAAAEAPASAPAAPAITATTLPPTFVPNSADVELEIAAAKALYTPAFPMKVDPFQIVTDAYTDWSSGMILIDLERKKFEFNDKLVLAPLTTVGNLPFRLVCREFGCDVTIGEMALSSSLAKGTGSEWALLRRHQKEKYFGVQITGAFADQVSRACELINETCQVDFVDYNAGCPIDQVTDKGMGSAMMQRKRTKNLEPILRSMRTMLDCPVTLKMRMGWSTTELTAMELLPIANRCGVAAVTIHGRTRQQRYTKAANWDFIHEAATYAKEHLNGLQVIGNGDVYTFGDYEALVNPTSNVATTMIARGALIKPWIFAEIKERRHWDISASERLDMLRSFVAAGHEHFGTDVKGIENTRRYLLEWLSFLHRYVPVGLLEVPRVGMQMKTPPFYARSDLEQLLASPESKDWIRISEMLIGPVPEGFRFVPKHKSSASEDGGRHTAEG